MKEKETIYDHDFDLKESKKTSLMLAAVGIAGIIITLFIKVIIKVNGY